MSGRGLPSTYTTALDTGYWRPVVFVSIELAETTIRVHSYVGDITWGANTWSGIGTFGSIDVIEEGEQVSPYALTMTLSGIDTTLAPEAIAGGLDQAPVTIYYGMLDSGAALLADSGTATAGAASTITLQVGSSAVDDFYNGRVIRITGGTGAGSSGLISDYVGATRVATVAVAWASAPSSGSTYRIDSNPIELWSGIADATDIVASRTNGAISITCESNLATFARIDGTLFSAEALRSEYSGDTFFDFLPNMQDLVIEWKETRGSSIGSASSARVATFIGSR
jgi:hypothetical protein